MALNFKRFIGGIQILGVSSSAVSLAGEVEYLSSSNKLNLHNGTTASPIVTESHTSTLTNKTIAAGSNTISGLSDSNITAGGINNVSIGSSAAIAYSKLNLSGSVVNADINASAAIAYSKLNLSNSILNADVNASAAIAYSKLNLSGSIVNADINASAAIARSKIASGSASQVVINDGSGNLSSEANLAISRGGTGQGTASNAFNALSPNTTKGDFTVNTGSTNVRQPIGSDGQVLVSDASQTNGLKWTTLNQGAKNYITYNNFENNATTGWSKFTTTLTGVIPTGSITATGASISFFNTTSSSPLAGSYSLKIVADAGGWLAGDGFITDAFTIDLEDQAKCLGFSFFYENLAGTNMNFSGTSSNTLAVYLYDVTNSAWIQPAGVYNLVQGSGVGYCTGTFQTTSNSTQYRLAVLAVNNSSVAAVEIHFDDFTCGPQRSVSSPAMSDWVSFTPTGSWSTNTTYTGFYRRKGDSVDFIYQVTLSGAPTSAGLTLNLPSGMTIDTTKLVSNSNYLQFGTIQGQSAAHGFTGFTQYNSSTSFAPVYLLDGSTASIQAVASITQAAPYTFANGDKIICFATDVPISGFSSNTVSSADTDTRVCAFYTSRQTPTGSISNNFNNVAVFGTIGKDSHGTYNASTGKYTIPSSGWYTVSATVEISHASVSAGNNIAVEILNETTSNAAVENFVGISGTSPTTYSITASGLAYFSAGDVVSVRPYSSGTTPSYSQGNSGSYFSLHRLSGPAVVQATESVTMRATHSSTTVGTSSTAVVYNTTDYDSHGTYNSSTGIYTVPVQGKYHISAMISSTASSGSTGWAFMYVHTGGSDVVRMGSNYIGTTSNSAFCLGDQTYKFNAGDTIQVYASFPSSQAASNNATDSWICIERIGN